MPKLLTLPLAAKAVTRILDGTRLRARSALCLAEEASRRAAKLNSATRLGKALQLIAEGTAAANFAASFEEEGPVADAATETAALILEDAAAALRASIKKG